MTACLTAGVSPSHFLGGPAAWDWRDRVIVRAWMALNESLCPQCGRPRDVHKGDHQSDYRVAFYTCAATVALDAAQSARHREDRPLRDRGLNPDRARQWFTYTEAEGLPA